MKLSLVGLLLAFALLFFVPACRDQQPEPDSKTQLAQPGNRYFVSATLIGEFTTEQLARRAPVPVQLTNGIRVYKVVYKTPNTDGTELQASGALLVPITPDNRIPNGLMSQQHGTITEDSQAPSYYNQSSEAYTYASAFAALGYAVACPDYIGYGESRQVPHPYEHRQSLATASLDMIRASQEFFQNNKITGYERLFITGYSQGGFATMSLQKMIEEQFASDFNLVASACGAGAYNKTRFMQALANDTTASNPAFNLSYVWVLLTYNRVYGINRPVSFYFREPYAAEVQSRQQNARIPVRISQALTDGFKQASASATDPFVRAVADNDVYDWQPRTPTRLFHGTADDYVFFFNSQDAFNAMRARGAARVELVPLTGRNHESAVPFFALGVYTYFQSFR